MPDFLDSLIARAQGGGRGLAPRTPSLFEPAPAGSGPGFGPRPSWAEAWADAIEAPIEERAVQAESDPSRPARRAVPPLPPSALGRQTDLASGAATAASRGDGEPARGVNQEREPGAVKPEAGAVSRRAAPRPSREPLAVPGAPAPRMPAPLTPPAAGTAPPGSRPSGRGEIAPGRSTTPSPGDGEARAFPPGWGASAARAMPDSRPARASSRPLARLDAELGALRRAEPVAGHSSRRPGAAVVIKTVDATARGPLAAGRAPATASPRHIHVSIGQVEVRAAASPAVAPPPPSQRAGSAPMGLDEYLRRRNGGAA